MHKVVPRNTAPVGTEGDARQGHTIVNSASMSSPCTSQQAQPLGSSRISVVSFLAIMTRSLSMEISPNCRSGLS